MPKSAPIEDHWVRVICDAKAERKRLETKRRRKIKAYGDIRRRTVEQQTEIAKLDRDIEQLSDKILAEKMEVPQWRIREIKV